MMVKEFRIPMPLSIAEYHLGQLYTTMETSKCETGGGDGVEEIRTENFTNVDLGTFGIQSGQYTLKKYHLDHKLPTFARLMTPKGCLHLKEESWNAYPYCKTVLTNEYLSDRVSIIIESMHLPDRGETHNALNLPQEKLQHREVIFVDIAQDQGHEEEQYIVTGKLDGVVSRRTNRGPLEHKWYADCHPVMTCYKLVTVEVKLFGLQTRMEGFVLNNQKRILTAFHRRMFMCMDQWYDLTMDDMKRLEIATKKELIEQIRTGEIRGSRVDD